MRNITDPRMLRAMAHPLRMRLVEALALHGPATATALADRLDDTASNCSWHLRQLAKFGLIEEAHDEDSHGRNRPWRWIPMGSHWGSPEDSPEQQQAGAMLTEALLGHEVAEHRRWESNQGNHPAEWKSAAFTTQTVVWLTAEELAQVNKTIYDIALSHVERNTDPASRPDGARPVRFVAWGVPAQ